MNLNILINQILILFLMIFLGFIIRKREIINEEIKKGFSRILIEITMPVLIINSILKIDLSKEIIKNLGLTTIISLLSYLFLIILSTLMAKMLNCSQEKKNVFKFLLIFANVGYMGIPVVSSIFPPEAVVYTIINNIVFNLYLWTYGIQIFSSEDIQNKKIQWKKLINQGTIALSIGFILLITEIPLGPIAGAIEIIGDMTFPLSMIIIGSSLIDIKITDILKDKTLYQLLVLKLFIIPLIALIILGIFNLPEMVVSIAVLMLAMPSGANTVIFAEKYNSDDKFASESVFLTTLISLFTIPVFIYLIDLFPI